MARIIDFIFPIATLPKDKKERNAVIEGYEKSIVKPTTGNATGLLFTFILLSIGIFPVSNGFSFFDMNIYLCILLPTLLYFTSVILFLYCSLKRGTASIHAKYTISLVWSFIITISCNGILNL